MAKTTLSLDCSGVDSLVEIFENFGTEGKRTINDVLHGEGAKEIKDEIARILPVSGRTWKKKKAAASIAMPGKFAQDNDILAVSIAARGNYGYLYFPDDGSSTKKHIGNQQFMDRGAQNATGKIIEICLSRLTDKF